MRALTAAELLAVWERGLHQSPLQRALLLLTCACPEASLEKLATLSIGRRDAQLLWLREQTFGPQLMSVLKCMKCGQRLELSFNVAELRAASAAEAAELLSLQIDGYALSFRLPDSLDLAAIAKMEMTAGRRVLLQRCLLASSHIDKELSADELPEPIVQAIVERMAEADPQADMQLAIACPVCDSQWQAGFDIVSFFWSEIDAWAHRLLREIHTLASAYGWREADILAMNPWRRQCYLAMISK